MAKTIGRGNKTGSVYKLSGNRRNPWRAIITKGWQFLPEEGRKKQIRETIGYYHTKDDALQALINYNKNPYDISGGKATFSDVYERWSAAKYPTVSDSNVKGYTAAYNLCESLYNMPFKDISMDDMQFVVDTCNKNYPTMRKLKVLFNQLYGYAVPRDLCDKDYSQYVDIAKHKDKNPNAYNRKPFSRQQVDIVWKWKDKNEYFTVILMLIYSGVRIGELLDLKKENVNLKEKWFDILESKTEAGIRKVPIADKVLPFFEAWYNKNDCEYLISTPEAEHFQYRNYYDSYWTPLIEQMSMEHRPHDTRHTCISLLTEAGVDERIIKKIVGHKGQGVTQQVYTHIEIEKLLESINKI